MNYGAMAQFTSTNTFTGDDVLHYTPFHALSVQYLGGVYIQVEGQGTPRGKGRRSGFEVM